MHCRTATMCDKCDGGYELDGFSECIQEDPRYYEEGEEEVKLLLMAEKC